MIFLASAVLASGVPTRAQTVPLAADDQATSVLERALAFVRARPRMRGRFEHVYLDRDRSTELRATGRFAIELPRIAITMDGEGPHTIAVDATTARVLVPRDGEAPLLLAFRIDTTPLPALLAVLAGTTPPGDAYSVRRVVADGSDIVELRPTDATSQVDRIWLEVDRDGAITRAMVVDWRGATHRVVPSEVRYPARIPASVLAPVFPADAVVVEP